MSATTAGWFRSSTLRLRARYRLRCPLGRSNGWTPCRVSPSCLRMFQGILVLSNGRTDQFDHAPAKLRPRPTSLGRRSECALGTMLLPQPRKSPRTFGSRFPTLLNGPIRWRLHGTQTRKPLPQDLRAGSSPAHSPAGCARSVGTDLNVSAPWPLEPWAGRRRWQGCRPPAECFWDFTKRASEVDARLCRGGNRARNRSHRSPMVARGGLARVRPFTWLPPAVTSGLVHALEKPRGFRGAEPSSGWQGCGRRPLTSGAHVPRSTAPVARLAASVSFKRDRTVRLLGCARRRFPRVPNGIAIAGTINQERSS